MAIKFISDLWCGKYFVALLLIIFKGMNNYHLKIFEQIRQNQNVFLLNGPSAVDLESKIQKLQNKKILYWGVNNISGNEANILSKIDREYDFWIINHATAEKSPDLIYKFLERKTSKILFVTADVLCAMKQYFCSRMPSNIHKICVINTNPFPYSSNAICEGPESSYNTITVLLYFFIGLTRPANSFLYIFGMDGAPKLDRKNNAGSYHAYNAISGNSSDGLMLYKDMLHFDDYTTNEMRKVFGSSCFDKIINANINSYYNSINKTSQDDCVAAICDSTSYGAIENIEVNFSEDRQIEIYNDITQKILQCEYFMRSYFDLKRKMVDLKKQLDRQNVMLRLFTKLQNTYKTLLRKFKKR